MLKGAIRVGPRGNGLSLSKESNPDPLVVSRGRRLLRHGPQYKRHAGLTLLVGVSGIVCLLVISRSTDLPTPVRPGPGARVPATLLPLGYQDLHTSQDTAPRETVDTISTQGGEEEVVPREGADPDQPRPGDPARPYQQSRPGSVQDDADPGVGLADDADPGAGLADDADPGAGLADDAGPGAGLAEDAGPGAGLAEDAGPGASLAEDADQGAGLAEDAGPGTGLAEDAGPGAGTGPVEETDLGAGQEEEQEEEEAGLREEILSVELETMQEKIEAILRRKREGLAIDMEGYHFHPQLKAKNMNDLVMERGGNPVRSLVITTWRSGSTFIGDILQSHPATFYHYEPLLDFGINQVRHGKYAKQAIYNLRHLLTCNYTCMDNYLEYGPLHPWLFFHNTQLWTYCKAFPDLCWQPDFLEPFCKLFPFQSVKTVRLRLNLTQELLEDKKLGVQVLLLVRDPRGTMQSRNHRNWCPGNADCDDPAKLCDDLVSDYNTARIFTRKFPHSFKVIRYEDLSFQAHNMTKDLFDFFHLDYHPQVQAFLDTHTKIKVGGVSSTFRNSKTAPVHWQQDLTWEEVVSIQKVCDKALKLWGYKIARYEKHLRSFNPVGKFRK